MSFDISNIALDVDESGVPMVVKHPSTGKPLTHDDGREVTIHVRSRHSKSVRQFQREAVEQLLNNQKTGYKRTPEEVEEAAAQFLAACTSNWSFDTLDGEPFPFNVANAIKFYKDPRFNHIKDQVDAFVVADGNFMTS